MRASGENILKKNYNNDNAFHIGAAIAIGVVVGVGVKGAAQNKEFERPFLDWFKFFPPESIGWIYAYQPLIAGIFAVFAAAFTIFQMERTDRRQEDRHLQNVAIQNVGNALKVRQAFSIFTEHDITIHNLVETANKLSEECTEICSLKDTRANDFKDFARHSEQLQKLLLVYEKEVVKNEEVALIAIMQSDIFKKLQSEVAQALALHNQINKQSPHIITGRVKIIGGRRSIRTGFVIPERLNWEETSAIIKLLHGKIEEIRKIHNGLVDNTEAALSLFRQQFTKI